MGGRVFMESFEAYTPANVAKVVNKSNVSISLEKNKILDVELFGGSIMINNENNGHFNLRMIDDKKAFLSNIQIGSNEDAPRNKGYGLEVYKQIIEKLHEQDIKLISTDGSIKDTCISPQALRVWQKLVEIGYAKVTGQSETKVFDRFSNGEPRIENIPTYESTI